MYVGITLIMHLLVIILVLCHSFITIQCSDGDRSLQYQKCMQTCIRQNCTQDAVSFTSNARYQQDIWCYLLQWNCRDECSYHCMWDTVEAFEQFYGKTPKFHGKWPFTRVLGVQEPAAAFSSLLNLAAHYKMYSKIRREFPMRSSPLVYFWHIFAFVCMNAWVWSAVFHSRDRPFTEFMDYACALSMVMALFFAAVVRIFHRRRKLAAALLVAPLLYLVTHVQYLLDGRVDYDYNMKVNVFFGVAGSVLWLGWSCAQLAAGRGHAAALVWFTLASAAALALELLDFPPLAGVWDAHALWHLATAPLPLLFYRFVIDDLRFLQSGQYEKFDLKLT